jgi:acid phosphatase family membrane protein YuiD
MWYNYVLASAVVGWIAAQVIKTILYLVFKKQLRFERLFGAGGMPSSHSAMVCAAVTAMGRVESPSSPIFAVCAVFALITMYDAMSVRRASGLHAREINRLNELFTAETETETIENGKKLKEFLGHTPLEVFVGALLGVTVAVVMPMVL